MTKIKICGLRRIEDIDIVNKYNPDYIGFIFVKGRKRYVEPSHARKLKAKLNSNILAVGVFLDEDINTVINVALLTKIDIIQLHGNESDEYIKDLKMKTGLPIINVYNDSEYADYVLVDNKDPGFGVKWDYKMINTKPCFIAGGIDKDNIKDILKLNPYAVDVSSGVEVDGFKDEEKIREIIREVRCYEG